MLVYNPDTMEIVEANKAAARMYGYSKKELQGLTILDLHPKREHLRLLDEANKFINDLNNSGVWEQKTRDGQTIFVEIISHPITISGNRHKLVTGIDVTEKISVKEKYKSEQELLDIIIEKLPGTFFVFNTKGEMLRWNKQLEAITGYSPTEILEKPITTYFEEKDYKKVERAIGTALDEGQVQIELDIIRKNGGHLPLLFNASSTTYHDEKCIVGMGIDISDLKKLLREKEVLVREVHHRVKNNLALVNSLLYLQSSELENNKLKHLLNESQARIKIIGLIHELLYEGESFNNISFGKHLRQLLNLTGELYNHFHKLNISLDINNLELNINQALPLSLILNEIFSLINRDLEGEETGELDIAVTGAEYKVKVKLQYSGMISFTDTEPDHHLGGLLISVLSDQLEADCYFSCEDTSECLIEFEKQSISGSIAGNIMELV